MVSAGLIAAVLSGLLVDLLGVMWVSGVQLNAISLVNLAIALGIGVEFCAHMLHAFLVAPGSSRSARSFKALGSVGASILSGITLTKFVGELSQPHTSSWDAGNAQGRANKI